MFQYTRCRIFWDVVVPTKTRKKSNKHGSGNAYFLRSVHLSIMADDVWLWVRLRDRQGKHPGNKYCMGTVIAEGQRDALRRADVTLSTCYNTCHEWTTGWRSPMEKFRATGRIKYVFPDPYAIVFFILWYVLPPLIILGQILFFSHHEQVQNSESMHFRTHVYWTFLLFWWVGYYHLSKYSTRLLTPSVILDRIVFQTSIFQIPHV